MLLFARGERKLCWLVRDLFHKKSAVAVNGSLPKKTHEYYFRCSVNHVAAAGCSLCLTARSVRDRVSYEHCCWVTVGGDCKNVPVILRQQCALHTGPFANVLEHFSHELCLIARCVNGK